MYNLALLWKQSGAYEKAEPLLSEILETERRLSGEDHANVPEIQRLLAGLYREQGRYEDAAGMYLEALNGFRRILGDEDPSTFATLHGLARVRAAEGDTEEAFALLRQALEGGFTAWGRPSAILKAWKAYEGNAEYEAIVKDLRDQVER